MKNKHFMCGRTHAGHLRRENVSETHYRQLACLYLVTASIGMTHGVPGFAIMAAKRGRARVAVARQKTQYLCHVVFAMDFTKLGVMFLRDRTTIAKACQSIEEIRDNPTHDFALLILESSLHRFAESLDLLETGKLEEADNDTF